MVMVAITKAAVSRIYVAVTAFTCSDNALARNDGIIHPTMVVIRAFFPLQPGTVLGTHVHVYP